MKLLRLCTVPLSRSQGMGQWDSLSPERWKLGQQAGQMLGQPAAKPCKSLHFCGTVSGTRAGTTKLRGLSRLSHRHHFYGTRVGQSRWLSTPKRWLRSRRRSPWMRCPPARAASAGGGTGGGGPSCPEVRTRGDACDVVARTALTGSTHALCRMRTNEDENVTAQDDDPGPTPKQAVAALARMERLSRLGATDAIWKQQRAVGKKLHAADLASRGDHLGAKYELFEADELERDAADILDPLMHTMAPIQIGRGGELATGSAMMEPFLDTVRTSPRLAGA